MENNKKGRKRKRSNKELKTESDDEIEIDNTEPGVIKLISKYTNLDSHQNPDSPVSLSFEKLKKSSLIEILDNSNNLTCEIQKYGHSSIKATHGVTDGSWYFEVKIETPNYEEGHTRIGWSRFQSELNAPVGYDKYSYSYRDVKGDVFHKSIGKSYGASFGVGDVIGCYLYIPRKEILECKETYDEFIHDGKKHIYVKKEEPEVISKDSFISFYLNGKPQGIAFHDIFYGKYYPSISLYMGAKATFNFKNFKFPPTDVEFKSIE
eukprot:gene3596-6331_t